MTIAPWKTGAALASTIAVSYPVCAVLYALFPDQGIAFLNALFHGLDFGKLATGKPFSVSQLYFPFVVLVIWGFLVGALFGWLRNRLEGRR
jgi:hypothetical protein